MRIGLATGVLLGGMLVGSAARADSFHVSTTDDSGAGSLRDAITQANAKPGPHTISISARGTINLASGLPGTKQAVKILGPGADQLTVQRGSGTRYTIFSVSAGAAEIRGLTIAGGEGGALGDAGGILVHSGSLRLSDSVLSGNSGDRGSAIYAAGELTIERSVISGNGAGAATIYAVNTTTITDTTIANNATTAIVFPPAGRNLTIDRSTISGNKSTRGVGGLQLQGGNAMIHNSTFSGNEGLQAGDFWTYSDGVVILLFNVTAIGSSSPSIWAQNAGTVSWRTRSLRVRVRGASSSEGPSPRLETTSPAMERAY